MRRRVELPQMMRRSLLLLLVSPSCASARSAADINLGYLGPTTRYCALIAKRMVGIVYEALHSSRRCPQSSHATASASGVAATNQMQNIIDSSKASGPTGCQDASYCMSRCCLLSSKAGSIAVTITSSDKRSTSVAEAHKV